MQSRDGGIYFGSGIDTKQFTKDIDKMRKDILSLSKEGADVDLTGLNDQLTLQKEIVKELEADYKALRKQIDGMVPGKAQQELVKEYQKLGHEIRREEKDLGRLEKVYEELGGTQTSVITQQRQMRYRLQELSMAGKENTEEFRNLIKELEGFEKGQRTVQSFQNTMRQGSVVMQTFTGVVRASAGAFAGVTGAMGLFSDKSERAAELQSRLQSVMAISIGIEQTYHTLLREGRLLQSVRVLQMRAAAKAQQLQTSSTIGATIAQRAFNAVAKANPYVLLATAIISVVGALALFTRGQREAVAEQRKLEKSVVDSTSGMRVQYDLLRGEWQRLGGDLDAQKKFIKDNEGVFKDLGIAVNGVEDAENALIKNTPQIMKAFELRAKAAATQELAEDAYKEYLKQWDEYDRRQAKREEGSWVSRTVNNLILGVQEGAEKVMGNLPSDKAFSAWDRYTEYIKDSLDFKLEDQDILKKLGLDRSEERDRKEKKEDKKRDKTFADRLKEREQLWADYYKAVDALGKDMADKVYGADLEVSGNLIDELKGQRDELLSVGELTQEQVGHLNELNDAIDRITKARSPFEKQKDDLSAAVAEAGTFTDKLNILEKELEKLGETPIDFEMAAHIRKEIEGVENARKSMYDGFVKDHQSYVDRIASIDRKREDLLAEAPTQEAKDTIEKKIAEEKYDAFIDMLKDKYEDLNKVFTDIESLTRDQLVAFREVLASELEKASDAAKQADIGAIIKDINIQISKLDESPLTNLAEGFNKLFSSVGKAGKAEAAIKFGGGLKVVAGEFDKAFKDIQKGADALGVDMDSLFMRMIGGMQKTMEGAKALGEGMESIGVGIISKNPVAVITGIAKAASGAAQIVGGWLDAMSGAGRESRKLRERLDALEKSYRKLKETMTTGSFDQIIRKTASAVRNLREQQELLRKEGEKALKRGGIFSFPDFDKYFETEEEIKRIQEEIDNLIANITEGVLGISARELSTQLGGALIEAFEAGEDAAERLNDTVDKVFKNMVKNMIAAAMQPRIQGIFDNLAKELGIDPKTGELVGSPRDLQLTPDMISKYRRLLKDVAEDQEDMLNVFRELFQGIVDEEDVRPDGLRGAIKGMSQETADILAGQFNAIRMDSSGILTILRNNESKVDAKLIYLGKIEDNTGGIYKEIKDLNSKVQVGDIRGSGL